jgi:hypothetical protein
VFALFSSNRIFSDLDCANPPEALGFWLNNLGDYEDAYWPTPEFTVWRQGTYGSYTYNENFVYERNGVVMMGLNLVAGTVHDAAEWENRLAANIAWIDEAYYYYLDVGARVMVISAHSGLDYNESFSNQLMALIRDTYIYMEFVIVTRNVGDGSFFITEDYNGIPNLKVVTARANVWPPMRVQVDTRNTDVLVTIDQDDWIATLV